MQNMIDIWTKLALVGAAVSFALYLAMRHTRRIACVSDWLVRVPRSRLAAFLAFALVATLSAQKGGNTNEPPRGASSPRVVESGPSVTPEDVMRGYRLDGVATNAAYSYAMPTNAVRHEKWWLRGAYEDIFRLDLDGMLFPLCSNLCDHVWVHTWGEAWPQCFAPPCRVVATGVPMSAVPRLSQFWSAATTNGTHLLT